MAKLVMADDELAGALLVVDETEILTVVTVEKVLLLDAFVVLEATIVVAWLKLAKVKSEAFLMSLPVPGTHCE